MVSCAAASGAGSYGKVGWQGYERAGGKLIFFTGEGEPCCSAVINENTRKLQGRANVDRFAKLYVIPGWGHCGGTNGPADAEDRLLTALMPRTAQLTIDRLLPQVASKELQRQIECAITYCVELLRLE